mmetsp:Transcript_27838/g.26668  ORF Transcript_27838/g.26668 Transcript_27838/m.26668 type:complete len:369 (+) Transcript_27838:132-1238(+)|eukprot:CAMPEP_0119036148 /NCGR_PEP_ID=MMETSP1177-20130426/3661_1 /TAXON_ID=2985 /ORGANISM="Ochromonas sp, Strain CCMP1899" /LENGTH=368 /DNA_ID=CAMNT_0006995523 /DNA_START=127 /DNA_END=1233 /DNA_ORIENTATION=-
MTKSSSTGDDMMAGAFAGASARLVTAPFDVLKIRFQLQFAEKVKYTSLSQAFATVIKEEGFVGLWKGNVAATYLWISYAMVQFGVYGLLKKSLEKIPDPFLVNKSLPKENIFDTKISNSNNEKKEMYNREQINTPHPGSMIWRGFILFLAGAGAGIAATATTYPFDIMRTQFAIQGKEKTFPTMKSFISHTYKTKGPQGFYAGLSPALVGITPYMGLNFALYESAKTFSESLLLKYNNKINSNDGKNLPFGSSSGTGAGALGNFVRKGLCGAVAGGTSKFLVYPLDTLKKRMQVQVLSNTLTGIGSVPKYNNVWHCAAKTYAAEGIRGFYKGIVPTTAKSVVATAVTFAAYEGAKDFMEWQRNKKNRK